MSVKKDFLVLIISALAYSCAYNVREKEQVVPPVSSCDTTEKVSWAMVEPIFQSRECIACHTGGSGPVPDLSDKATFSTYISGNKDKFLKSINYEGLYPMPKGKGKMPEAEIKKITAWICQGLK